MYIYIYIFYFFLFFIYFFMYIYIYHISLRRMVYMFLFVCKFLHLISLFVAGGGGIGSAVIQSIYKKEGKVPEPHLSKGFQILAFLSLLAILTMWVTGACADTTKSGKSGSPNA